MEQGPNNNGKNPAPGRRKGPRTAVRAEATLRRDGANNFRVNLFDVSPAGCRVETVERPRVGEGLWVKFGGLEPLHAIVRWIDGPVAGVEFDKPIHPAVFDLLLKRLG